MKTLQLQRKTRQGTSTKEERHYFDLVISGHTLRDILGIDGLDLVSPFGWNNNREHEDDLINVLTLQKESDLATGRVMLYVCPECGDIDCGAITANVISQGDSIIWKDFGYETGTEGVTEHFYIEPIEFERHNYFAAFSILKKLP